MSEWPKFSSFLRERMTAIIENDPRVLLEHDGGPCGIKADIYLATLYGHDEQVDAEWRIPRIETTLLRPIMRRPTMVAESEPSLDLPIARYELQSSWATMDLDYLTHCDLLPLDVRPDPGTNLIRVALLRYRRRAV